MATYGKPTTEFFVNYGALDPAAAQRALAPVIIAPRYVIETAKLGVFGGESALGTVNPWNDVVGTVDTETAKIYAKNAKVVSYEDLAFTKGDTDQELKIASSALKDGPGLAVGDIIKFDTTTAKIIKLQRSADNSVILVNCNLSAITDFTADVYSGYAVAAGANGLEITNGCSISDAGIEVSETLIAGEETLAYGELFVEYRVLLKNEHGFELHTNQEVTSMEWAGVCDSRNPMGMMYAAASGAADGAFFYMLAVDNDADYEKAIEYVGQFEDCYSIISYKQTEAVQKAIIATINKYSTPKLARFKRTWLCAPDGVDLTELYTTNSKGSALQLTVEKDSADESKLTFTIADADLFEAEVMPGDTAVVNGDRYTVAKVLSATEIELSGWDKGELSNLAIKFCRESLKSEKLAAKASEFNSARVNFVVADGLMFAGEEVSTVYACAALAAQRCALSPHAPMNDMELPGFTITGTTGWTDADYEQMNAGGCWVLYRDIDGRTLTYHQITTLTDGSIAEEDSCVSNDDSIVRTLRQAVAYLCGGKGNATEQLLGSIRAGLIAAFTRISAEVHPDLYGPRIISWDIRNLYIPEGNSRSIMCDCRIDTPQPTQDSEFHFNLF